MCCWLKILPSEMRLPLIVFCVLLATVTPALSDEPINFPRIAAQLSRAQLMESVGALSGFDGRQSGTAGGGAAAAYPGRISHADKERTARAKGAVGYLAVTGPVLTPYEQRRGMSTEPMAFYDGQTEAPLPGLWITPAAADSLLEPIALTLESFQRDMEGSVGSRSGETGSRLTLAMEQHHVTGMAANVLGFWSGSDPDLHNETILLGAHYDHFGIQGGMVFPGADDNASGTAVT